MAAPEEVCHYVKHFSRPLIFTASMPPAAAGATLKALEIIETEPERRRHLLKIAARFRNGLRERGFKVNEGITPIIPVLVGDMTQTFYACKLLFDAGVYVNPVVAPAVPPDATMIRTSLTATHTEEQVDQAVERFTRVGRELGII